MGHSHIDYKPLPALHCKQGHDSDNSYRICLICLEIPANLPSARFPHLPIPASANDIARHPLLPPNNTGAPAPFFAFRTARCSANGQSGGDPISALAPCMPGVSYGRAEEEGGGMFGEFLRGKLIHVIGYSSNRKVEYCILRAVLYIKKEM